MAHTIGQNIRKLREHLAWTQEHLAAVTVLSTRTIQRIEDGGPASAESLLAFAAAFEASVDDLRRSPEDYAQLEAQAAEVLKNVEERYRIVRLERIERASALSPFLSGADAMMCEHVDLTSDAEEDAVAEFEGCLRESLDVWSEVGPMSRRGCEKDLQKMVEGLGAAGLLVAAGSDARRLRMMSGQGEPVTIHTLYLMISRTNDPKLFIAVDKKAPVQFTA